MDKLFNYLASSVQAKEKETKNHLDEELNKLSDAEEQTEKEKKKKSKKTKEEDSNEKEKKKKIDKVKNSKNKSAVLAKEAYKTFKEKKKLGRLKEKDMLRIMSFLSLNDLIEKGIFINKALQEILLSPKKAQKKLLSWNQNQASNFLGKQILQKKMVFHMTSQFSKVFDRDKQIYDKLQTLVKLCEVCVLEIDYSSLIEDSHLKILVKFVMDNIIANEKDMYMAIMVDEQLNVKEVKDFITLPVGGDIKMKNKLPSYFDFVKHIELIVGDVETASSSSSSSSSSEENGSPSDSLGDDISQFKNSDMDDEEKKEELSEKNKKKEDDQQQQEKVSQNKSSQEIENQNADQNDNEIFHIQDKKENELQIDNENENKEDEDEEDEKNKMEKSSEKNKEESTQNEGGEEAKEENLSIKVDQILKLISLRYMPHIALDPQNEDDLINNKVQIDSKAIHEINITRQNSYKGPIFISPMDKCFDKNFKLVGTKRLVFDGDDEFTKNELKCIENYFPSLSELVIEAENILELQFDLRQTQLINLRKLTLVVKPSDEHPGLVHDDDDFLRDRLKKPKEEYEVDDEQFEVLLNPSQRYKVKVEINVDDFSSHDIAYTLKNFGMRIQTKQLTVRVGTLKFAQDDTNKKYWGVYDIQKMQKGEDLGNLLTKTKIGSALKVYEFFKGKLVFKLADFQKNKFYGQFPYEIIYERQNQKQKDHKKQQIRIYAEDLEIRLKF